MVINVTGVLKSPTNKPKAKARIRITALSNLNETLSDMTDTEFTGSDGSYDFELVYGEHRIELLVEGEEVLSGEVVVDETTGNPIELPALLNTSV